jgi:hypothetical protein
MDEEFVGGTSLQGACSNFRGKLCVWAHLLKISADNSKGVVDKLVPQGSGQAAVDKILSSIDKDVVSHAAQSEGGSNSAPSVNAWNAKASEAPAVVKAKLSQQPRSASTGPARSESAGRSASAGKARAGSAGRGKQGAWREAKGPPEKGIGFKGARKSATSGLKKWKSLMASNKGVKVGQGAASNRNGSQGKAAELKAMLGVTSSVPPPPPQVVANAGQSGRDAAAGLKALLGVGDPPQQPVPPSNDGFPPPPPAQLTAADRLLQLMSKQHPEQVPMSMPQASSFNFTYVEEGKEPPPPSQRPQMSQMGFPPPPSPPMQMQMGAYGQMPPMYMQMPHPNVPPMQMMGHPNQSLPLQKPASAPPLAVGLSAEEFPPLGGSPPELVEEKKKAADVSMEDKAGNMMVPSVVSSKPKGK